MLSTPIMAFSLLLTPVTAECSSRSQTPHIEVTTQQGNPDFTYNQSTKQLDGMAHAGNTYRPNGTQGPAWHTAGLTQSNIKIKQSIENHSLTRADNTEGCVFIDKIALTVELSPVVWVANDFAPGSCMYNAVRDHEMKHVNVDRTVTARHLSRIRAALNEVSQGRALFGPARPEVVKAQAETFVGQLHDVLNREAESFYADESQLQHAVDTLQEYERVSHLCPH